MKSPKVIKRGKITYVLYPNKITVGVGGDQWVSYNKYSNWNKSGIKKFKDTILKSKEGEYSDAVSQMSLAIECGIKSTGTTRPTGVEV